jgi:iron complex transport system ATP-binding protein
VSRTLTLTGAAPAAGGRRHLIVTFDRPAVTLSSAAWGGGLRQADWIAAFSVARDWSPVDATAEIAHMLAEAGLDAQAGVGLVTAVDVAGYRRQESTAQGWMVEVIATVGIGNAVAAGLSAPVLLAAAGTINLIVLIYGRLSAAALVGAVQTATEAKAAALNEAGVCTAEGWPASGTSTDTVTVACLREAPESPYAGPATPVGAAIGRAVRASVAAALNGSASHD